ncbi:MAG: ABC transporter ATP-binding protein [Acidobacteria bacterium]|nr:ABC transporter ATP-binding protein [Acidobacteriota bacterium]
MIRASKVYSANGNAVYAVREVDLVLERGSFTAVVGRSGCGKTTLLNLAGAVDLPTSGEVRIEQRSTRGLTDDDLSRLRRTRIGFIFQFFHLLPTLTVAENVELPLLLDRSRYSAAEDRKARERVRELLAMIEIENQERYFPHQLSGGQMQRVAVARALVHRPTLVLADEPTGNLDSASAETVLLLLRRISREMGHTVLMATHSREAAEFASRALQMRDGCLLAEPSR